LVNFLSIDRIKLYQLINATGELKALFTLLAAGLIFGHGVATFAQAPAGGFFPHPVDVTAPRDSSLALLLATNAGAGYSYFRQLDHLVRQLGNKRKNADHARMVKRVFDEGRRRFLHSYNKNYPHFDQLFTQGSYNCVTGTALYAWVLQRLGYPVQIHETAFHAYLTVQVEHTGVPARRHRPQVGLRERGRLRGKRALWYTGNELQKGVTFNRLISFRQLCGLQYYNQGVVAFNARDYDASLAYLRKALELYPESERIANLERQAAHYRREVMAYAAGKTFASNAGGHRAAGGE
jgi:tetratricopeptide (TPR) repeat protein